MYYESRQGVTRISVKRHGIYNLSFNRRHTSAANIWQKALAAKIVGQTNSTLQNIFTKLKSNTSPLLSPTLVLDIKPNFTCEHMRTGPSCQDKQQRHSLQKSYSIAAKTKRCLHDRKRIYDGNDTVGFWIDIQVVIPWEDWLHNPKPTGRKQWWRFEDSNGVYGRILDGIILKRKRDAQYIGL